MTLREAVAKRLDEVIEQHQITPYKLAQKSGIAQSSISDIRSQKCKTLSVQVIYEILDSLEMGLDDFFVNPLFKRENITE